MGGNFASQKEKKNDSLEAICWNLWVRWGWGGIHLADLLEHLRKKLDRYKAKSANG